MSQEPATGPLTRPVIQKPYAGSRLAPNLGDYANACTRFSWEAARAELDGLPGGRGLNIAHEAVDRHALGTRGERPAILFMEGGGGIRAITYGELRHLTNRFANLLRGLGARAGDTVATLLGRAPELYVTALGTLKNRSIYCPLYTAFGPEPLRQRLRIGRVRILVTTHELYRRKVEPLTSGLPDLEQVLLVGYDALPGCRTLGPLMAAASPEFDIPSTDPEDPALLHFTSGTTGLPKAALHVHAAVLMHHMSGKLALDIHPEDLFWCTADPGWVTGTSYGILSPLTLGATLLADPEPFDAERWYRVIQNRRVSVWYTSPTAIRLMMRGGTELARRYDTSSLRLLASVGEPLNPEAVLWGLEAFGRPFHDTWWQTETGAILIANFAAEPIRPGSMGRPLPGIEAAIVHRRTGANPEITRSPDEVGELAVRAGWPSMFRGYLGEPERYAGCFSGDWYLSGDLARRDADGWFWFVGRSDDVIKTAGHLIGPFEVENVLMEHPAVAEAAVIGKPDTLTMESVKAFVTLKKGLAESPALARELLAYCRRRLGAVAAPKEIEFRACLPRTRSGKILRRLLKAEEMGLPPGDVSTLENEGR